MVNHLACQTSFVTSVTKVVFTRDLFTYSFLLFMNFSQEYKAKQEKVQLVRQELKSHLENLPDLTKLPDPAGGLAPLPSAGDLFASGSKS